MAQERGTEVQFGDCAVETIVLNRQDRKRTRIKFEFEVRETNGETFGRWNWMSLIS